jgi:HAD superfamily hydrolase (TIGR01509 family)
VSAAFGGIYSAAEVNVVMNSWVRETYADTAPMLAALKADGNCKVAVLSNTCSDHWRQIAACPWIKWVDYAFPSHELGIAKPSPEAFAAVESATQEAPEQILFFDDAEENIAAAAQRGWNSIFINSSGDISSQIRDALPAWAATSWRRP